MSARSVADSAANPQAAGPGAADSAGETAADRLFLEAVDREDPADRAALLDARCEGDPALRAEVEALLAAHGAVGGVLDRTLDGGPTKSPENPDAAEFPPLPETLGDYRVLEPVGRGGMGVVWRARDRRLDRIVAIKALAPQLAADPVARRRFVREARAAAAVTHPHVVTIHAVEPDGPTPFLVMEYVAGRSLKEKLDADGPLELRETLRIGAQIAAGLAAAHERGLIHRDVKPGNVLLENGVERVKLTDFGLARAADDVALTRTGQIAGTPQYMSPEQAEGKLIDVRSDLFSLGGVLYAMAAGRPPFRGDSTLTVLRGVCDLAPRPLREENPEVPPWLAALVERLLAKNPDDRGLSAAEVAALLNRRLTELENPGLPTLPESEAVLPPDRSPSPHLASNPARRPARGLRRWATAAAVLLASLVGMGAAEATGVTEIVPTVVRLVRGEGVLAIAVSDPNVGVTIEGEDLLITGAGAGEIRLKPGAYTVKGAVDGKPVYQQVVTVERSGREVVNVRWEPKDRAAGGEPGGTELAEDAGVVTLPRRFGRDDKLLNMSGVTWDDEADAWQIDGWSGRTVRLYEVPLSRAEDRAVSFWADLKTKDVTGRAVLEMRFRSKDGARSVRGFSAFVSGSSDWDDFGQVQLLEADGRVDRIEINLIIEGGGTVWLRNAVLADAGPRWVEQFRKPPIEAQPRPTADGSTFNLLREFEAGPAPINKIAFYDGGRKAVSADRDLRTWDVASGRQAGTMSLGREVRDFVLTPDERFAIASVTNQPVALKVDLETGAVVQQYVLPGDGRAHIAALAVTPDGSRLVAARQEGDVAVFDALTGRELYAVAAPERIGTVGNRVGSITVAVSPDGVRAAAGWHGGGRSGEVFLWDVVDGRQLTKTAPSHRAITALAFSREGLMVGDSGGGVVLLDPADVQVRQRFEGHDEEVGSVVFLPDGRRAVTGDASGLVCLWDLETGRELARLERPGRALHEVAVSPDGRRLLTGGGNYWDGSKMARTGDYVLRLWAIPTPRNLVEAAEARDPNRAVRRADRDPQFIAPQFGVRAPVGGAGAVSLVRRFEGHTAPAKSVAVSPDGERVASGSGFPQGDQTARVWEVETGRELHVFKHPAAVMDVTFSPDGSRLLTGAADGFARVFDLDSGEELRRYRATDVLMDVAYSPDGASVLAASHFGEAVYVWDADTGHVAHVLKHERRRPLRVVVSPDGERVVAADDSGQLLVWSLDDGTFLKALPASAPDRRGGVGLALSPDGRQAMTADNAGLIRLWDLDSGAQLWSMMSGVTAVQGLALAPDGATALAVGGAGPVGSRALAAIDWQTGEKRLEVGYEGGFLWDAAFLPDGERFVTVSGSRWMQSAALPTGDNTVSLWRLGEVAPEGRE